MVTLTCQETFGSYNYIFYRANLVTKTDLEINWGSDAGKLPLNFTNTVDWHASSDPEDLLEGYSDLVRWAADAKVVTREQAAWLTSHAERRPREAAEALTQAIELRETLYRIFSNVAGSEDPPPRDIANLNQALSSSAGVARLARSPEGYDWEWDGETLDWMLGPIARSAAELLTSPDLHRVGECSDDRGCGYLFLDSSRNHSRKWCRMDSCGNRAKARRHYQKQSQLASN